MKLSTHFKLHKVKKHWVTIMGTAIVLSAVGSVTTTVTADDVSQTPTSTEIVSNQANSTSETIQPTTETPSSAENIVTEPMDSSSDISTSETTSNDVISQETSDVLTSDVSESPEPKTSDATISDASKGVVEKEPVTNPSPTNQTPVEAETTNKEEVAIPSQGFYEKDNNWYYKNTSGVIAKGYSTIDGLHYYFDENGRQLKGFGYDTNGKYIVTDHDTGVLLEGEAAKTAQYRDQVSREFTKGKADITYYDENGKTVSNRFVLDKYYPTNIDRSAHQTGWLYIGADGKAVTGDQLIDGVLYHFDKKYGGQYKDTVYHQQEEGLDGSLAGYYYLDENGRPVKNAFIQVATDSYQGYYYADQDGHLAEGWKTIGGKTYYFAKLDDTTYYNDHRARFGQIKGQLLLIDGANYYFDPNTGEMLTNQTVTVDGKEYTLGQDGKVQENYGFITKEDGQTYYQLENGDYAKGLTVIDHKNYYFDKETGQMVRNKIVVDEDQYLYGAKGSRYYKSYYFGKDGYGVQGLQTIDGKLYYFGTGGQSVSSNYPHAIAVEDDYYFVENDQVVTNQLVSYNILSFGYSPYYGNKVGYYGADGKLQQGWYEEDGQTYYTIEPENSISQNFKPSYTRANGLITIDHNIYYFDKTTGQLKTNGWYQVDSSRDEWRYMDENGKVLTGWQVLNGKTYYYGTGQTDNGNTYISEGVQVKGKLLTIDGYQYYFDPNSGELWTNRTLNYGGYTYQLDDKGRAVQL
ncbi:KxYKxGKxW signal peptide domain-containing protein [Streptococcus saliviloxodontae]|uniref:Glucan-binding repeat-containing protein n=1 Tax=Streptococcus saliviloxodontae TaxID=1349416 RepID=A0ABS2PKP6_9STRE|nr:KxYKxGKxW signal peptide domain-containing protein [Streptococcus saliviloxodontae]MBM7636009.1 glucan-binding repeat-containing protein [Streptococcus saliviloxodontae]